LPFDFVEAFLIDRRRFSPVSFLNAVSLSVYPSSFDLLGLFLRLQHLLTLPLIICHWN